MSTPNKQKIRHEIQELFRSIANSRSREHYDVLDSSHQRRSNRTTFIVCISMVVGIVFGIAATLMLKEYSSMQQYSLPTPDIEEFEPNDEDFETVTDEPTLIHLGEENKFDLTI